MADLSGAPTPERGSAHHVLFVITEDWFFASHFLALAEAVRNAGYRVSVHLRVNDATLQARIEAAGIRVIASAYDRGASTLRAEIAQLWRLRRLFARERPDVVHLISLRVVLLGGLAARWTRVPVRVHALTGMGLLGAGPGWKARAALDALGALLRRVLGGKGAGFLFENTDDPQRLGFASGRADVRVVGGAGIDVEAETALPMPPGPTLRVAVVARMIYSKGVAVAVEALTRARAAGADVTLTLVGGVDSGNPRALRVEQLEAWAQRPGIRWVGRTQDVRAVWRDHHVACVPSLGGEGLPRSLLEAAAAARAIVTTDTPGCRSFVRNAVEGFVVPPGDVAALAAIFGRLAGDRAAVEAFGAAARRRVVSDYTHEALTRNVLAFYEYLRRRVTERSRPRA